MKNNNQLHGLSKKIVDEDMHPNFKTNLPAPPMIREKKCTICNDEDGDAQVLRKIEKNRKMRRKIEKSKKKKSKKKKLDEDGTRMSADHPLHLDPILKKKAGRRRHPHERRPPAASGPHSKKKSWTKTAPA